MASFYGLEPDNSLTLALSVSVPALAGLVSALSPAHRAASVDPVKALRES